MKNKNSRPEQSAELRKHAEKVALLATDLEKENLKSLSLEEIQRMVHELRVHQIELEVQNEELLTIEGDLEMSRSRYFNLYDLAPVGYFTISEKGQILEANLTAATMLGANRRALIRQFITRFILREDQDIYYKHRKMLFESGEQQICELRMIKWENEIFWARMEAAETQDAEGMTFCRCVISDITRSKQVEEELRKQTEELKDLNSYFVDREIHMIELKEEINELLVKAGGKEKYVIHTE
jgi:PAS domain S-box-containing protein